MPAKPNPFTQGKQAKEEGRPTIDDVTKSAAEAMRMIGETVAATAGHFAKLAAILPETQEVHALRERAKKKVHDLADSL